MEKMNQPLYKLDPTNTTNKHVALDYAEHRRRFWVKFYKAQKKDGFVVVSLTDNDIAYAKAFARKVIDSKMKEAHHQRDNRNETKRWVVGTLGEVALGKYLGIKIHDDKVGDSLAFNVPDLKDAIGMHCGVKAFSVNNFPLTNRLIKPDGKIKWNAYPQVFIGICSERNLAYIFGMATVAQLIANEKNLYNSQYVKDENALERKVAFTNLENLHSFKDVESLKTLISGKRGLKSS